MRSQKFASELESKTNQEVTDQHGQEEHTAEAKCGKDKRHQAAILRKQIAQE